MSEPVCFDRGAYRRWMAQAANTLESARVDADHGFPRVVLRAGRTIGSHHVNVEFHPRDGEIDRRCVGAVGIQLFPCRM